MRRTSLFISIVLALASCTHAASQDAIVTDEFLQACTDGKIDQIKDLIQQHPQWAKHGRSEHGETCLHVAGIQGQAELTKFLIVNHKADPNVRTTYEKGLRMHPLSWNVYGGHVETVKVLLENGALVNADIDDMHDPSKKVTVLDIVNDILSVDDGNEERDARLERHYQVRDLLLEYGAKVYKEL